MKYRKKALFMEHILHGMGVLEVNQERCRNDTLYNTT